MRISAFLYLILILCLASNSIAEERQLRVFEGHAIISVPYSNQVSLRAGTFSLSRLDRDSFIALKNKKISSTARALSIQSKEREGERSSIRYRKSLNPCRSAVLKRLLRIAPHLQCEPDWEIKVALTPNDTSYASLYAMGSTSTGRIHAPEAWELSTGSTNVVVGIIDTGIDYTHPDLVDNIWTNPNEIPGNGIDDDGNGYIDDVHGIDVVNGDSDPMDDHYHGTHVAGTIGGKGNNSRGVVGVSWSVKMIGCKFLNLSGSGSTSGAISCVSYLTNLKTTHNIPIIATNNSWGGGGSSNALLSAIQQSRDAGIIFVAAAGNAGTNNDSVPNYPSNYASDNVIAVAAIDSNGNLASFSNYGATTVDIGAPGVGIYSTIPGNQYANLSGTSMATPHVTGAIALLKAYAPNLTYSQIISSILSGGTSLSSLNGLTVTGRTLNVYGALQNNTPPTPTPVVTATNTPIRTPTSTPNTTATQTPEITATPTFIPETATPIPSQPTPTPVVSPTPDGGDPLDPKNIILSLKVRTSRARSLVTCSLSERVDVSTDNPLVGYEIRLMSRDQRSRGIVRAIDDTDENGVVRFNITAARWYWCRFILDDGTVIQSQESFVRPPASSNRR